MMPPVDFEPSLQYLESRGIQDVRNPRWSVSWKPAGIEGSKWQLVRMMVAHDTSQEFEDLNKILLSAGTVITTRATIAEILGLLSQWRDSTYDPDKGFQYVYYGVKFYPPSPTSPLRVPTWELGIEGFYFRWPTEQEKANGSTFLPLIAHSRSVPPL